MSIIDKLHAIGNIQIKENEPLSKYTGFRTGGLTTVLEPKGEAAFCSTVILLKGEGGSFRILGNGTNTLALDDGYNGFIIRTKDALDRYSIDGTTVTAGAGVSLTGLCNTVLGESLTGLEFAYGIPGTIGGGVYMNAGAYDGELKDVLKSVRVLDLSSASIINIDAQKADLSYRSSIFKTNRDLIILEAVFELKKGNPTDIKRKMDEFMSRRVDKQPLEYPSCGSTFKRPVGNYAGKLIQDCGLKGYRVGDAAVSEKHSGFVVNMGNATTEEILSVVEHVQKTVKEITGYELECEIEVLS